MQIAIIPTNRYKINLNSFKRHTCLENFYKIIIQISFAFFIGKCNFNSEWIRYDPHLYNVCASKRNKGSNSEREYSPSLARNSAAKDSYIVVVCTESCLSSPLPSDDSDSLVLRPSLPKLLRALPSTEFTLAKLSVCDASAFNWPPNNSAVSTESHLKLKQSNP